MKRLNEYLSEIQLKATEDKRGNIDAIHCFIYNGKHMFTINSGYPAELVLLIKRRHLKDLNVVGKVVKGKRLRPRWINWLYPNNTNKGTAHINLDLKNNKFTLVKDFIDERDNFPKIKKGSVFEFGKNYLKRIK